MIKNDFPCKDSYIGAKVRAYAHVCDYCGGRGCDRCHGHTSRCDVPVGGICQAVVDDAAGVVYLYGNVKHEDYHVPDQSCLAYTGVVSAGFPYIGTNKMSEVFEGEQDENNITLKYMPIANSMTVYLNGLKQIEGAEYDYQMLADNKIHFNFYNLLDTDKVEVVYGYTTTSGKGE